jgi:membrane protein implicated in regulation of membrane protease activity
MERPDTNTQTSASNQEPSVQEALSLLQQQLGELSAYASHYVSAKMDGLKLSGRNIAIWAMIGALAGIILISMIVVAVVLLLIGCAAGLGVALGGTPWLGQIAVGLGLLALFVIAILIGARRIQRQSRSQKVQDYDERQRQQRIQFGHNVNDIANESGL